MGFISKPAIPVSASFPTSVQPSGDFGARRNEYTKAPTSLSLDNTIHVAVIDDRTLLRDCFGRSLSSIDQRLSLTYYADFEAFEADLGQAPGVRVALACVNWSKYSSDAVIARMTHLKTIENSPYLIVVSEINDLHDILKMIEHGVSGYIPISDRLEVAAKAIELVAAGGIYLPPELLFQSGRMISEMSRAPRQAAPVAEPFTARQLAVIEAVSRGKANKVIAYELNMCESTVKVHLRNVMKKLKARNRTELAFIFNNRLQQEIIDGNN